jgi:hypothetical protein
MLQLGERSAAVGRTVPAAGETLPTLGQCRPDLGETTAAMGRPVLSTGRTAPREGGSFDIPGEPHGPPDFKRPAGRRKTLATPRRPDRGYRHTSGSASAPPESQGIRRAARQAAAGGGLGAHPPRRRHRHLSAGGPQRQPGRGPADRLQRPAGRLHRRSQEVISYIEAHDNDTLWDAIQLKAAPTRKTPSRSSSAATSRGCSGWSTGRLKSR